MEKNKYLCYVFLAGESETNQLLNVFCKVSGYTKEEARENVAALLKDYKEGHTYTTYYVGTVDFHDIDQAIIERQAEFFEKHDSVWILNCSFQNQK